MSSQVSSPQFVTKSATSANQFIESIGVNTHLSSRGSPYANISLVKASLDYLGIDNIRDNVTTSTLGQSSFNELAAAGYKFDYVLSTASNGTVDIAGFIAALKSDLAQYQGSISAIEGPNEVNNAMISLDGTTKSIAAAAVVQQELYTAVNADAALASISIYNTTIGSTNTSQFAQLGNLSAYTDYANEHAYVMSTSNISAGLDYLLSFSAISAPGKPAVITETGYTTLTSVWYNGVSEAVQAKYTLDTLMDAYQKGVPETYLYELLDESQFGSNSSQSHFGLFHADGSPKLAATAIHNLTDILHDTGASASTAAGGLTYALSGAPTTSHDMVLAKSNGNIDLVLWAEPVLWDQSAQSAVAVTPSPVTVTFAQTESLVKVYDPLLGSAPIATYANVSSIQVTLSDHPLVIEVTPVSAGVAIPVLQKSNSDFDANGHSDILLVNDNGTASIWNNGQMANAVSTAGPGTLSNGWHFAGTGDFDDNGQSDIVWQNDNGAVSIWDNGQIGGAHIISDAGVVAGSWHIAGTGDFDGNGQSDILWRNDNGAASIWDNGSINGAHIISGAGVVANSWHIAGTGDFDGNGHSDVLWVNDNGAASIWDNGQIGGAHIIANPGTLSNGWHFAGTGDFDGNGHSDILWVNDNGAASVWDNGTIGGAHIIAPAGVLANGWHFAMAGDFDANGKSDILWHNDNGALSIWNNGQITGAHIVEPVGTITHDWHIV